MHAYGDTEHYHSLAFTEILFCYNFGYAVLGNRLNVTSHQNHHQHQRITKVRADKGHTKRSLQSAVVGKKICIRILLVRSAVTVRILHVVQSADPHVRRSAFYQKPTDSPAVPPANLVGDAFGKQRPVGRCGGGSVTAGTTGCGWVEWCRFWSTIT